MGKGVDRMLILTRNQDQRIFIGDDITITVLGMRHGQVKIGIDAPKEISVHREEVAMRIQREKEQGNDF